jgi:NADPH2:quinone reductase
MSETRQMVALDRFGGPEVMRWVDGPVPEPQPGEVLVDVDAIGINFADTMVRRGEYRRDQPLSFTPGFEVAGRLREDPSGAIAAGTRVVVFAENGGAYADVVAAPAHRVLPTGEETDPVVAAGLFLQAVTAWYAVDRYARVAAGHRVLIHAAAGGVGGLSTQMCVRRGATVIATASTPEKRAIATAHGAQVTLAPDPDTLAQAVREATGGRGVDAVIDGVAGDLFPPSLRALGFGGRYVVVGAASQKAAPLDARVLMPRNQSVSGFVMARVADEDPREPLAGLQHVLAEHAAGRLRPQIEVLRREDLADAHARIEARTQTGKLVLDLRDAGPQ